MDFKEIVNRLFSKLISRKFIMTMILAIILVVVFLVMIKKGIMSETVFGIWLAGLLASFGIYTGGNIITKKVTAPKDNGKNE